MISLRGALGRPAIDRSTAEELGTVSAVVIDASQRRVAGIVVGSGRKASVYGWGQLTGFGPDAVLVGGDGTGSVLDDIDPDASDDAGSGRFDPLDKRVLTDEGFEIGHIADLEFDEESGSVSSLVTDRQDRLDPGRLRGIGSYAVVVADEPVS